MFWQILLMEKDCDYVVTTIYKGGSMSRKRDHDPQMGSQMLANPILQFEMDRFLMSINILLFLVQKIEVKTSFVFILEFQSTITF